MEEEDTNNFRLNEKSNLNPNIERFKNLNDEQKKTLVNDFQNPVSSNFKMGEKRGEPLKNGKSGFFKFMTFLAVISLLIIAGDIGYSFYYNYNTYKELTLFPKQVCSPVIPKCPDFPNITIPKCPDCSCGNISIAAPNVTVIPNITLNPSINVFTNST